MLWDLQGNRALGSSRAELRDLQEPSTGDFRAELWDLQVPSWESSSAVLWESSSAKVHGLFIHFIFSAACIVKNF